MSIFYFYIGSWSPSMETAILQCRVSTVTQNGQTALKITRFGQRVVGRKGHVIPWLQPIWDTFLGLLLCPQIQLNSTHWTFKITIIEDGPFSQATVFFLFVKL